MSGARRTNLAIGILLVVSVFAWHHSPAQLGNTGIMGIVIAALALLAGPVAFRIATPIAAMWLFCSTFVLPEADPQTVWNNCLLAVLAFGMPLSPAWPTNRAAAGDRR